MDALLSLQNLKKYYATQKAVDDISFDIERGSIFGLLGPNGAGKTTLLRMITGIFYPDSGNILLEGAAFNPMMDVEKIGYMPEERGMYKKMKIGEQAIYLAQLKGMSKAEATEKIKYWFKKFEMETWWNKKVEDLFNSYILELTPLGNVIMRYNSKSETFDYFSDNAIPYRILETISRKYVLRNNCTPLYVDMEQSLKESEEKAREREKETKERNLEKEKSSNKTKNIFASFKSYNKQSISNNIQNIPPPRNGSNVRVENKETLTIIKEQANRYSHQGKIVNFDFLKKIDKKIVNKKLAMSFADFKAMNIK
jgi:ABC-type oligopeptide transport system ATPase subunit